MFRINVVYVIISLKKLLNSNATIVYFTTKLLEEVIKKIFFVLNKKNMLKILALKCPRFYK